MKLGQLAIGYLLGIEHSSGPSLWLEGKGPEDASRARTAVDDMSGEVCKLLLMEGRSLSKQTAAHLPSNNPPLGTDENARAALRMLIK